MFVRLMFIMLLFCVPIYIAAEGTTDYDSHYLVVLNFLAILILTLLFIGIWCIPALIVWGIYKTQGLCTEDVPDKVLYVCAFIGFVLSLYFGRYLSDFYEVYRLAAVRFVYGQ